MSEENTIFDAMEHFKVACEREGFSSSEVSLFFALAEIWNRTMRSEFFKAWNSQLFTLAGTRSDNTLKRSREKLISGQVIFYAKEGNRGQPHYSLNALFDKEIPPLLAKIESKAGVKRELTVSKAGVKRESPQGKGKGKVKDLYEEENELFTEEKPSPDSQDEWTGVFPKNSLQKSATDQNRTKVLRTNEKMIFMGKWFNRKPETLWSVAEARALKELDPPREEVEIMNRYRNTPSDYHRRDLLTLLNNWTREIDRAQQPGRSSEPATVKPPSIIVTV